MKSVFKLFTALLCLCLLLCACTSPEGEQPNDTNAMESDDILYTYEQKPITWTYPGATTVAIYCSFGEIKDTLEHAAQGDEAYAEIYEKWLEPSQKTRLRIRDRDEFLTTYDFIKDCPILVPKGEEVSLKYLDIESTHMSNVVSLMLSYQLSSTLEIHLTFLREYEYVENAYVSHEYDFSHVNENYEDALPVYHGDGFDVYVKETSSTPGASKKVPYIAVDGVYVGRLNPNGSSALKDIFENNVTSEDIAELFGGFEVKTFHEAVMGAKEPK